MHTQSKKELLKKSGLYLVTDRLALKDKDITKIISQSVAAGVDIVQLRDKEATSQEFIETGKKIKAILKGKNVLFIVNDRIDEALLLESDGIHLGQDDISVETARKVLGKDKIIGLSTHSIAQLRKAIKKDVDYISVGPIFKTPTKPDYAPVGLDLVEIAKKETNIPFIAIGGINQSNIQTLVAKGAKRIAVVRAILSSADPFMATKDLLSVF
ncbi:MAG: thiamine phosphate synthase [Candidatus Omnitrophota bacterium]|jgi:thiamine-phosphate pyrophosphorylase|nr:thiamine phosphate synthase [Candidatus Omnitrophota bacterium]